MFLSDSILLINFLELKKGNVANQREHLVLLLANMDVRGKSLEDYKQVNIVLQFLLQFLMS